MKRFGFILTTVALLIILLGLLAVGINFNLQNKAYAQETKEKETPKTGEATPIETPAANEASEKPKNLTIEGPEEITVTIGEAWSGTGYFLKEGSGKYKYFDVKNKNSESFPKWIKVAPSDDNSKLSIGLGEDVDLRTPENAFSCQLVIEGKDQNNTTISQTIKVKIFDSSGKEVTNPKEKMPPPPDEEKSDKTTKKEAKPIAEKKYDDPARVVASIGGTKITFKELRELETYTQNFIPILESYGFKTAEVKINSFKDDTMRDEYIKKLLDLKKIGEAFKTKRNQVSSDDTMDKSQKDEALKSFLGEKTNAHQSTFGKLTRQLNAFELCHDWSRVDFLVGT